MTPRPPPDPLSNDPVAWPPTFATVAELRRLGAIRRRAPWVREAPRDGDEDDLLLLLELLDRLLGRAPLPGEDVHRRAPDGDEYRVEAGASVYMCGHGGWSVRRRGSYRTLVTLTCGPLDAARLADLLNGREL